MFDSTDDTMRDRIEASTIKFWLLTRTDRRTLTGGISIAVFLTLIAISTVSPAPMRRVIEATDALWWVFSPMLTAIITAVALVVTFTQLVLSQELGALGDQRERMEEAVDFRNDVESTLAIQIAPPDPASFLAALLESVQHIASELEASVDGETDEKAEQVREFADTVFENARTIRTSLEDAQFGTFDVVAASLQFNYSKDIYEARKLRIKHSGDWNEETENSLDSIVTVLEFYGTTREHLKTLYFQWELINLSRAMLYASIPALVVALSMLLYVDSTAVPGSTLGIDNIVWLVCAAVTVTLLPFFLLISYVLRIASVAKRTLAIGPFVLREIE